MSDIASTSASAPVIRKSRGANPSTDYKSLFLKSKDKFDRVSTEHTDLKANVVKATAKQQKLREELDYLLDAVAAKREQRAQVEHSRREHALELEREAAADAARRRANPMSQRDIERERDAYEIRSMTRGYEAGEEYRPYAARYAEPSYHAFGSGITRGFASPPPPVLSSAAAAAGAREVNVPSQRGGERYPTSEGSPQASTRRDSYAAASYRRPPSRSPTAPSAPSSSRRQYEHDLHSSSPTKYDAQQRYRESTPPLASSSASSAIKRPRPTSVERELLETDEGYHSKRARND